MLYSVLHPWLPTPADDRNNDRSKTQPKQVKNINKDNSQYIILEKEYDGLINEVRKLEGELADYNLAQDKFRAGTKVEDIMALFHHIKSQNDKKKQQLDELFIERKEMENEFNDINSEINRINAANEEKVNELDPDKREQYNWMKSDN